MAQVRSVDFLPEIFQTDTNRQFLAATLDQLVQEPSFKKTQGYIGQTTGPGVNPEDKYVVEPTTTRTNYQLEPGVIGIDPNNTKSIKSAITYPGINDALAVQGASIAKPDRLYTSEYYTWDPFVDFDSFVNFSQYYWIENGPAVVSVASDGVPLVQTFDVTRANGVYTFSGIDGELPTLNLVRGGNYVFNVAQNNVETINFRVTRTNVTSFDIDFQPNAAITLVRGNTYVFTLSVRGDFPFWIKTAPTTGTGDQYNNGVQRNGSVIGAVTFTVPQTAPDTLYYSCQTQSLMNGVINVVDGTPGTGAKFWIQTNPGVSGQNPVTPNISSRQVLGVTNNGTDLGSVLFNVPAKTAQNFFYSLTDLGSVDLITNLKFDQIDGVKLSDFIDSYGGIDGITNLDTRTLIFVNNITDPVEGGWFYHSTPTVTPVNPAQYTSVWRISYYTVGTDVYMALGSVATFPQLNKVITLYGTEYSSTQWWKNQTNQFEQIPVLSAEQDILYYQDGSDPEIFGRIRLLEPTADSTIYLDEILGQPTYTSPNGVKFTNGLKVRFLTDTVPSTYATKTIALTCTGTQAGLNFVTCESSVGLSVGQTVVFSGSVFGGVQANTTYYVAQVFSVSQFSISTVKNGPVVPLTSAFGLMSAVASQNPQYYVSGVGSAIQLLPVENYITPEVIAPEYQQLGNQDYITISRDSPDLNAWSRSNRWFHIEVLNATGEYNNTPVVLNNDLRAKRPILQFRGGIRLFNNGTKFNQTVDVIDFLESDALSNVEGATSYTVYTNNIAANDLILGNQYEISVVGTTDWNNVAGTNGIVYAVGDVFTCVQKGTGTGLARSSYELVDGTKVIFAADDDANVRNKIYVVNFIVPSSDPPLPAPYTGQPVIHLTLAADGDVLVDQITLSVAGEQSGVSFWFNGTDWLQAQQKYKVQQAPLFDIFDTANVSLSNASKYPSTTFVGTKLFSYAEGTGIIDPILQFKLQYLTLQNVGDIVFDNNLYKDTFIYVVDNVSQQTQISQGYVQEYSDRTQYVRRLGWQTAVTPVQVRQQFRFVYNGASVKLDVAVLPITETVVPPIQIFANNVFVDPDNYVITTSDTTTTITFNIEPDVGEILEIAVLSNQTSKQAFYQVPINLEKNPINANSDQFTLGTIRQHYETICENLNGLIGPINGANNTRDIGNLVPYGQIILQQSSPLTLAGYFMRSEDYNVFGALEFNSREYQKFKNQMLEAVTKVTVNFQTAAQLLDQTIAEITTGRNQQTPFYWTDMIPATNVFTTTTYTISPISGVVFDTVQVYDYTSANYLGMNVYLNNVILTRGEDYVVATDGPRLTILTTLAVGDVLTLQEYSATYGSYVPNTPSKMGLYPLWRPAIITVKTTAGTQQVLQGHDGSQTVLFGDIRDEVLFEFETRIFNNAKVDNNPIPLTIFDSLPGQFRDTGYSFDEINTLFEQSFLIYIGWNKLNANQQNYNAANAFSYNYSQSQNKLNNQDLLGAWRGIYRYFYDTQQPQVTPWEMLGFTIKPDWWNITYGAGPWSRENLNLWDDLEAGIVRDPAGEYVLPQFVRPGLTKVIPVGSQGELLAPLDCVVGTYVAQSFKRSWSPGDGAPVEASWWNSSDYPFAVMRVLALTRPAKFFALFADRDLYRYNTEFDQILFDNRYRLTTRAVENQPIDTNITVYGDGVSKASYINWIVDYNRILGTNATQELQDDLKNLDVRLCYRMASFSDKQYIKLYVEKSSPNTLNTTLLLPDDSYQLLLYKNQPFDRSAYSAVVVQTVVNGWAVFGYSLTQPYFNVLTSVPTGIYKTFNVAGVTIRVPSQYSQNIVAVPYGFVFSTREAVADFLLSYGKLLEQQGFMFDTKENGYIMDWSQMVQEFLYWSQQGWQENTLINLNPAAQKVQLVKPGAVVDRINTQTLETNVLDQNKKLLPTRDLNIVRLDNEFVMQPLIDSNISYTDLRFTSYESMIVIDNASLFGDLIYDPITGARQSRMYLSCFNTTGWNGTVDAKGFILNQDNVQEWVGERTYTKGELVKYKNVYWSAADIVQPSVNFNYNAWIQSDYTQIELGLLPNIANKADQLANSYNINSANLESDNDLLSYGLIGYRPRQYFAALNLDDVSQINVYRQFLASKGTLTSVDLLGRARLNKEVADYSVYENWAVLRSTYGANANRSYVDLRLNSSLLTANPSTVQLVTPQQSSIANQPILLSQIWKSSFNPTTTDIFPIITESITDTALPTAGYVNFDDADITVFSLDNPAALTANLDTIRIGTTVWVAKVNNYDWNIYRTQNVPGVITHVCENLDGTCLVRFSAAHGLSAGDFLIIKFFDVEIDGVYRVRSVQDINSVNIVFDLAGNRTVVNGNGIGFTLKTMRVAQASDIVNLPYAKSIAPGARVWVDNNGQDKWTVLEKTNPFTHKYALAPRLLDATEAYGASVAQTINRNALFVGSPRYGFGSGVTRGGVYLYVRSLTAEGTPISPLIDEDAIIELDTTGVRELGSSVTAGSNEWAAAGAPASLGPAGEVDNGYVAILYRDPTLGAPGTIPWTVSQLLVQPSTTPSSTPGAGEFGHSVSMSLNERWLYVGTPGLNQVHVYGRVDWQDQTISFRSDGTTASVYIADVIQIDNANQISVTVDGRLCTLGVEYTVNAELNTVFFDTSTVDQVVRIIRNSVKSYSGGGTTFSVQQYLFTAINTDSLSVFVDSVIQRPNIDYTYDGSTVTFGSATPGGSTVVMQARGYFTYVATLTGSGVGSGHRFGQAVTTTTDGRNVIVGAPNYTVTGGIDTVTSAGVAINGLRYYNNVEPSSTSGSGRGALFDVKLVNNQYSVTVIDPGFDYTASDTITINGSGLGGSDTVNDLVITVASIQSLSEAGALFAFDRNVQKFIYGTDTSSTSFTVLGTPQAPVSVLVNNERFINVADSTVDQTNSFVVSGNTVTLQTDLAIGDIIEIETNQFVQQQRILQNIVADFSNYGTSVDICSYNCSLYAGAPNSSLAGFKTGAVERTVNQARIYGVIKSTVANPALTSSQTLRVNNVDVAVPSAWSSGSSYDLGAVVYVLTSGTYQFYQALQPVSTGTAITNTSYWRALAGYTTAQYALLRGLAYAIAAQAPNATASVDQQGYITVSVNSSAAAAVGNKLQVAPGTVGSVYSSLGFDQFVWTQSIVSPRPEAFSAFGTALTIDDDTATNLVVGAPTGSLYLPCFFDIDPVSGDPTTFFDGDATEFFSITTQSGAVYTFDYLPGASVSLQTPGQFVFGQQVQNTAIAPLDQYGAALSYVSGLLIATAPGHDFEDSSADFGVAYLYDNANQQLAWQAQYTQQPSVDVRLLTSVYTYDRLSSAKTGFFDFFDPLQGKILGAAAANIDFISALDPAQYNFGAVNNNNQSWGQLQIGKTWWNLSSVRFIDPNQDSIAYASKRWGQIFPGSTVDVYQWVASSVPPANYQGPGLVFSINSYSVKTSLNINGTFNTTYYFWVSGITTTDTAAGKTLSIATVANYIADPKSSGIAYLAPLSANAVAIYNAASTLDAADTILSIEYDQTLTSANVHQEYELIAQGRSDAFLSDNLYRKLQDSFCGVDVAGNLVPDVNLPPAQRYGVSFRPRQSMFANRYLALKNYIVRTNQVMARYPMAENTVLTLLYSQDPVPTSASGDWNLEVANLEILSFQNIYAVPLGYRYLVLSDSNNRGLWTIYTVSASTVPGERQLVLTKVQNYKTSDYWSFVDWYLPGYNPATQIVAEVANYASLSTLSVSVGSSVKVTANAQGKFEIYLRTDTGWQRVGLEDGTIEISNQIYDYAAGNFGFDVEVFDAQYFDQEPVIETRKIIQAINQELFVGDLAIERNINLTLMFDFVLSEFQAPEWLVKTSLIDVDHKIRDLVPFQNYIRDNQDFVIDYIQEVKPYHVQIREFNLAYTGLDVDQGDITDFDLPAYYDTALTNPQFVSPILLPYAHSAYQPFNINSDVSESSTVWSDWPYNQWYTNFTMYVDTVTIAHSGSGYTEPPVVTILAAANDTGEGAVVRATINSLGQVTALTVVESGSGYRATPTVVFSGVTADPARAYPVMQNDVVRQIKTTIRYDRTQYNTSIETWSADGTYDNGTLVRFNNRVWRADSPDGSSAVIGPTFELDSWTVVPAGELSGVDRSMGYYVPAVNEIGLDLNLMIPGTSYPAVQVWGDYFLGSDANALTITCTASSSETNVLTCDNTLRLAVNAPIRFFGTVFGGVIADTVYYVNEIVSVTEFKLSATVNGVVFALTDGTGSMSAYIPQPLDAQYASAFSDQFLGLRPSDINVEGGNYIGVTEGHAPEELVNGSEFDTVDIRVYTRPGSDWTDDGHGFEIGSANYTWDSVVNTFSFAGIVDHPADIMVCNATTGLQLTVNDNFTVNWAEQTVSVLSTAATQDDIITIYAYEVGGGSQLYRANYAGTEVNGFVIVPVDSAEIYSIPIFVNGNYVSGVTWEPYAESTAWNISTVYARLSVVNDSGNFYRALQTVIAGIEITNTDYWLEFIPTTASKVQLNTAIQDSDGITMVVMGIESPQRSWSTAQTQYFVTDATIQTTQTLTLTNSLQGTNPANLVVLKNGLRLKPPEGIEWIGDGTSTEYGLPERGAYSQVLIDAYNDVSVWVDNVLQAQDFGAFVGDYYVTNWTGTNDRKVIFAQPPAAGAKILISVDTQAAFQVIAGVSQIQLVSAPNLGDIFAVTTWNDTSQQDLLTLVFVGPVYSGATVVEGYDSVDFDAASVSGTSGSFDYTLGTVVASNDLYLQRSGVTANRLWVTYNGLRLIEGQDYTVSGDYLILSSGPMSGTDVVVVTEFTEELVPESMAFRIFQDMSGYQTTYRITAATTTVLTQDLSATSDTIHVQNAASLPLPDLVNGYFGIITIDGERILYRNRNIVENTVSGLQRGTAGTGAASHQQGALVYDMSVGNRMPQADQNYVVSNTATDLGTLASELVPGFTYTITELGTTDFTLIGAAANIVGTAFVVTTAGTGSGRAIINGQTATIFLAPSIEQATFGDSSTVFADSIEVYVGGQRARPGLLVSQVTVGNTYTIAAVGNTDWYAMGLPNNIFPRPGVVFTVTAMGTGSGVVGQSASDYYYQVTDFDPLAVMFLTSADLPAPPSGVAVTILERRGVNWYQPGVGTASDGRPLQITNTDQARFLRGE